MDFSQALDQVLQHCEALRVAAESAMRHGDEHQQYCVRLRDKLGKAVEGHKKTIQALNVELDAVRKLVADQQVVVQEKADMALFARKDYEKVLGEKKNLVDEAINLGLKEEDIPSEPLPPKTYVSPADRAKAQTEARRRSSSSSQNAVLQNGAAGQTASLVGTPRSGGPAEVQRKSQLPGMMLGDELGMADIEDSTDDMFGFGLQGSMQQEVGNRGSLRPGTSARPSLMIPEGFDDDEDDLLGGGLGGLGNDDMLGGQNFGMQASQQQNYGMQASSQRGTPLGLDMGDDFDDDFAADLGF